MNVINQLERILVPLTPNASTLMGVIRVFVQTDIPVSRIKNAWISMNVEDPMLVALMQNASMYLDRTNVYVHRDSAAKGNCFVKVSHQYHLYKAHLACMSKIYHSLRT